MSSAMTRRRFLKAAGAAGGALAFVNRRGLGLNEKLQHACIGVGGMGGVDLRNFLSHRGVEIVALCDVDANRLAAAGRTAKDARRYSDWRELLARERGSVDSVNVSVPDHMHAAVTVRALRARKHVYCQKPLCHDIRECRAVAEEARRAGVVTQLGTQHASGIGDRMAVQFIKDKVIGQVRRAYLCSNRPGVEGVRLAGPRPERSDPVPGHLDWDLWIGTAPERPYVKGIYHPAVWRAWQDFGTGWSGDIGCHIFDAAWKGLSLFAPKTVTAEVQASWRDSPARRAETWPQGNHITWVFPGNGFTEGDLTVEWFDGEFYPPEEIRRMSEMRNYPAEALFLLGTEGSLLLPHTCGPLLLPRERFRGHPRPDLEGRNHYHRFVDACLGGPATESAFSRAGPMAETVLLGTVAVRRPGELLEWDAPRMMIPDNPGAGRLLERSYRRGWEVDGL
jgi:predicted dehydrogenase